MNAPTRTRIIPIYPLSLLDADLGVPVDVPPNSLSAPSDASPLIDPFQRRLRYLRLSVTDMCNFSCDYCLPNGYQGKRKPNELSVQEIRTLVLGFAQLGTRKVRVTGGEPSTRRDLPEVLEAIADCTGIEQLAISTNGYKLHKAYADWLAAGVQQINISIDSFDPQRFADITGHALLPDILSGVDALLDDGRARVKLNGLLRASSSEADFDAALAYVQNRPITYRFIEYMRTRDNAAGFEQEHLSAQWLEQALLQRGWQPMPRTDTAGPAQEYHHPDYVGGIGIIAPYGDGFCQNCNRVRVSAQGKLHLCLFDSACHDLRPALAGGDAEAITSVQRIMRALVAHKPEAHKLHQQNSGVMHNLSLVGG